VHGLFGNPGDQRGNVGGPINALNFGADRSDSSLDHRHTFVSSVLWDLPFGHGKKFGSSVSGAADKIIGGWQWNVIFNGTTGQHYTVLAPFIDQLGHNQGNVPANLIGPAFVNGILNGAGFTNAGYSCSGNPLVCTLIPQSVCYNNLAGNQFCYGDSGRNRFTGPGYFRTDMSIFKNLTITERLKMQIGLEAFNIFNQADSLVPNTTLGGGFGNFQNTWLPPRIIQYRARLIF
jgi:hypothetical protein